MSLKEELLPITEELRPMTQDEIDRQYLALIRQRDLKISLEAESRMGPIDPDVFARESCKLSRIDPDTDKDFFKRYKEVATWTIRSDKKQVQNPAINNAHICGHAHYFTFRTGKANPMDLDEEGIPRGKAEYYMHAWMWYADYTFHHHRDKPYEVRDALSWGLHDAFICLRMFQDANSRTARLHFLEVRRGLGLPLLILRHSEASAHRRRIAFFKRRMFIPFLKKMGHI